MTYVIGLDPGQAGGIAIISPDRRDIRAYGFKDKTEQEIYQLLAVETLNHCQGYLEKVGAMPGQGVTSMFNFGHAFGFLKGALAGSGVPYILVPPQTWQLKLGLGHRKLTYSQRKTANRQVAQQMFPHLKITNQEADALLIAEYGYRTLYKV